MRIIYNNFIILNFQISVKFRTSLCQKLNLYFIKFLVKMEVYYKVSILSRAQPEPKRGLYSMKKKELKEKSMLEDLTILWRNKTW